MGAGRAAARSAATTAPGSSASFTRCSAATSRNATGPREVDRPLQDGVGEDVARPPHVGAQGAEALGALRADLLADLLERPAAASDGSAVVRRLAVAFAEDDPLPLGVSDPAHPPEYEQVTTTIPAGATLALYTDGLVESRLRNVDEGIARLASALVTSRSADLDDTADGVLALLADQRGRDDIALLLVRPA